MASRRVTDSPVAEDTDIEYSNSDSQEFEFTLRKYLSNVLLPAFKSSESKTPLCAQILKAPDWPEYAELHVVPGTRRLRFIQRTGTMEFLSLVIRYFQTCGAEKFMINNTMKDILARICLPTNEDRMCEEAAEALRNIDSKDTYATLVQEYIFQTVSECLRIIKGHNRGSPEAAALEFRNYSNLCTAHQARWDIIALPGTTICPCPFLVFMVPPWEFGNDDFTELVSPQQIDINKFHGSSTNALKMWAVIHDTCRGRGRFFVVSNYARWAFGEVSPHDNIINITLAFEAPILKFSGMARPTINLGCNVVEMLTFWTSWALDH